MQQLAHRRKSIGTATAFSVAEAAAADGCTGYCPGK